MKFSRIKFLGSPWLSPEKAAPLFSEGLPFGEGHLIGEKVIWRETRPKILSILKEKAEWDALYDSLPYEDRRGREEAAAESWRLSEAASRQAISGLLNLELFNNAELRRWEITVSAANEKTPDLGLVVLSYKEKHFFIDLLGKPVFCSRITGYRFKGWLAIVESPLAIKKWHWNRFPEAWLAKPKGFQKIDPRELKGLLSFLLLNPSGG